MKGGTFEYKPKEVTKNKDKNEIAQKGGVRRAFDRFKGRLIAGGLSLMLIGGTVAVYGCNNKPAEEQIQKVEQKPKSTYEKKRLDGKLLNAVRRGEIEKVRELIDGGADVNAKDYHRQTALMEATWYDRTEITKLLIDRGADVNAKTKYGGITALILATRQDNTNIAKLLIDGGADMNAKDKHGKTALGHAKNNEMKALLKKHGAKE